MGELRVGVCRHRALLYKYCADRVGGLSCRLVRGDYHQGDHGGGHAWNVVMLNGQPWLCDVMHKPGELYEEESTKATAYKRLAQRGGGDAGGGAGMGSILPPRVDAQFAHLSAFEVKRSDLEPCTDSVGAPVVLGRGGGRVINKGKLRGHDFVAVKRVRPGTASASRAVEEFKREVCIIFSLRHAYVVDAVGFSSRPDDMFLAMEFMPGGS